MENLPDDAISPSYEFVEFNSEPEQPNVETRDTITQLNSTDTTTRKNPATNSSLLLTTEEDKEGLDVAFVKMMIKDKNYPRYHQAAMLGDLSLAQAAFEDKETYPTAIPDIGTPLQIAAASPPYYRLITFFCTFCGANPLVELTLDQMDDMVVHVATSMNTIGADEEEYMVRLRLSVIRVQTVRLSLLHIAEKLTWDELRFGMDQLREEDEEIRQQYPELHQIVMEENDKNSPPEENGRE